MRVLFVHDFYQQYGGEDAVVQDELSALELAGLQTLLYCRRNEEIQKFGWLRMASTGLSAIASGQTRRELSAVIDDFRPDVAYLHNLYPLISPSAYDILASRRVPIVQVMHNFRPFCANGLFYVDGQVCTRCASGNYWPAVLHGCAPRGRGISAVYAAALWRMRRSGALDKIDCFVCLNSFVAEKLVEAGLPSSRIVIKPNAVDVSSFTPEYGSGDYALFLGRLSPEKGVRTLVQAARSIPAIPVVIAGAGPLEEELKQSTSDTPNVRLEGFQSGAAKRQLIRGAQYVVLCSEWYENFPVVLLEAFASGKPVIGSSLGSLPRLIEPGRTGLLFETGSPADLARQMELLSSSPDLRRRMGEAARKCAEERYDRSRSVSALMSIFERAIGREVPRPASSEIAAVKPQFGGLK